MSRSPRNLLALALALVLAAAPAASIGRPSPRAGLQAVVVSTGGELARALARRAPATIILEDGVYARTTPFEAGAPHRIVALHSGRAWLTAGLVIGGDGQAGGASLRGLVFDVRDPKRTLHGAIVHLWGRGGENARVTDCVFDGNGVLAFGLYALSPDGLVAERLRFRDFTDVALRASDNVPVPYGAATPRITSIADVTVDGVSRPVPGSSDGTAEAGLWIGHPVARGVARITIRNASWSGIETVNNAWDTTYSDLDIDMSGPQSAAAVGIYLEHFNHGNTFERFTIRGAAVGITAEWADPGWGGVAGAHDTTIRMGLIDAADATATRTFGIYLDEGTASTTISGVVFRNQSAAAIDAYRTTGINRFEANDTTGIFPGALPYTEAQHSAADG